MISGLRLGISTTTLELSRGGGDIEGLRSTFKLTSSDSDNLGGRTGLRGGVSILNSSAEAGGESIVRSMISACCAFPEGAGDGELVAMKGDLLALDLRLIPEGLIMSSSLSDVEGVDAGTYPLSMLSTFPKFSTDETSS